MLIKTNVLIGLSHTPTRGVEYLSVEVFTIKEEYYNYTEVYYLLVKQFPLMFSLSDTDELEFSKLVCSVSLSHPLNS